MPGLLPIKTFVKRNLPIAQAGLLTGLAIVFFEAINLLVIYRHVKLDYYLSLVAVCFFAAGILISKKKQPPPVLKQNPLQLLTVKEQQVLKLVAAGKTNKEIAADLFVEVSTVKTHVNNIYTKLSVTNRGQARAKYAAMAPAAAK